VIEDGEDGENEPLKKAIALIRSTRPAAAIEFHWNGGPPSATGIEVLCKSAHKTLAQGIAGAIHAATGLVLRGDRGWKPENSGQHERLGFCEAGGLIVEVCFISSKVDMNRYTTTKGHVAANIAEVLAKV
ncbi:MAG: N-acetylmuramoyl-L-alanine amidase, partial [Pyrinomonadaceae bacterium]